MCGLTGGWALRDFEVLRDAMPRMTAALSHRGPDDSGQWSDADAGVAFGHRRLAIVDLSPQGHQPMLSSSKRFVLAFNGEIYNHLDLRRDLEKAGCAPLWRGHSDSETLLAVVDAWGVEQAIRRCVGMFAIALWDRSERELWLFRDRLGEKPLYYGFVEGRLVFGSELKAIRQIPGFSAEVDRDALQLFMRYGAVPGARSIYQGIRKLLPGTSLRIRGDDIAAGELPAPRPYWSVTEAAVQGQRNPFCGSDEDAINELERLFGDAISQQMIADVPLGAFLSGGIDSSVVVASMQAHSSRPVKTFTIGFEEQGFDEATYARQVAQHLCTEHTELYVRPSDALDVIPKLPLIYDEPFADSSQIPTCLVSVLARRHVTVSLSGDGGDELFLGYGRYQRAANLRRLLRQLPGFVRGSVAFGLRSAPHFAMWGAERMTAALGLQLGPGGRTTDRAMKLAELMHSGSIDGGYRGMMTRWNEPVVLGASVVPGPYDCSDWPGEGDRFPGWLGLLDLHAYLPDVILTKVDRAAMAASLETRVPMLDHRVVEFALSLPQRFKWRDGQAKWLLRQVLYRYVPASLIDRPKKGFGVPVAQWLRGPLREWAEALLDSGRLRREGYLEPSLIVAKWQEHVSGARDWQAMLWNVLMFQAWLDSSSESLRP